MPKKADPRYVAGQKVVLTGWRVGGGYWGGYAEKARVNADWRWCRVPKSFPRALLRGRHGNCSAWPAMLAIDRLEANGLKPGDGEVLVTRAGGGVGPDGDPLAFSFSVMRSRQSPAARNYRMG